MSKVVEEPGGGLGTHIIADFFGCKNLDNEKIKEHLLGSAETCGATVLHTKFHEFAPHGITGYILLAESHISIHTWPEYDYAALDVFTCGNMDPHKAVDYLKEKLGAEEVQTASLTRGAAAVKGLQYL